MKDVRGLSLSGASTKIPAIAGAAITLMRDFGYEPKYISGISAGSILAVPLALGLYDEIEKFVLSFTLEDVFDNAPVNENGKITLNAIGRIILGKESLGSQNNLKITLSKVITPERFKRYKEHHYPSVYIGYVEYKTGKRHYVNAKFLSYEQYLDAVMASTSIPLFVESVKIHNGFCYDGGVRDHIGSHWLMNKISTMTEHFSIYSRPENVNLTKLDWTPKNIFKVLERTIEIMNAELSKADEKEEDAIAEKRGIKTHKVFMPYILASSMYQADRELLEEWFCIGRDQVTKYFKEKIDE